MKIYIPDRWVVLELATPDVIYKKVLAGWSGSYLQGDSWKLSSAIENTVETDDSYEFTCHSGSVYRCHKHSLGLTVLTTGVLTEMKEEASKTDWIKINIDEELV